MIHVCPAGSTWSDGRKYSLHLRMSCEFGSGQFWTRFRRLERELVDLRVAIWGIQRVGRRVETPWLMR